MKWGRSMECLRSVLGGEEAESIERDRGNEIWNRDASLYRNFIKLDRSRAIESYQALKRRDLVVELAIEDLTRGFLNREVQWIEIVIE